MRNLVMGCTVAALVALSVRSEARPSGLANFGLIAAAHAAGPRPTFGIASWYGEKFQGRTTASGKPYDMNGLTAANLDLPFGTKIKVTNLKNNKSLVLTVNDRGPYVKGRFLDVSKEAAVRLGFLGSGLAHVQSQVVSYPAGVANN